MFYIYFGFRAMKKLLLILMIFPIVSFNKISLNNNIILLSDPTVLRIKANIIYMELDRVVLIKRMMVFWSMSQLIL